MFLWVDDGRVVALMNMNSTSQWSILWNMALLPPQEMLPTESLFCTLPCNNTTSTNSEHLFGFSPCIPPLTWENSSSTSHERDMSDSRSDDNAYDAYEDFSALFAVEEFKPFV